MLTPCHFVWRFCDGLLGSSAGISCVGPMLAGLSLWPCDVIWHQGSLSTLFQVVSWCCWSGITQTCTDFLLIRLSGIIISEISIKCCHFHWRKWCLQNGGYFVQASLCKGVKHLSSWLWLKKIEVSRPFAGPVYEVILNVSCNVVRHGHCSKCGWNHNICCIPHHCGLISNHVY